MAYKVNIYAKAELEFLQTIEFLLENWSVVRANKFARIFQKLQVALSLNPYQYLYYDRKLNIHCAPITRHNMVYYQIDERSKVVVVLTVFNVFQNPEKFKIGM